jgi:MIP family channel proteins
MYSLPQKLAAEFAGTFAVVFVSAGAICADQFLKTTGGAGAGIGPVGIALAYGLSFGVLATATMPISGGHLNPAITAGHWVTRRVDLFDMLTYIIAQLAGAVLAGYLLRVLIPEDTWQAVALGTPNLATGLTRGPGMLLEGILTAILVFAIFGVTAESSGVRPQIGGLIAGLLLAALVLTGWPFTGAALNPARVFGPALASRHWANHGVYWVGPLAGGATAAAIYDAVFSPRRTGPS